MGLEFWPETPPKTPPLADQEDLYEIAVQELPECPPPYDWGQDVAIEAPQKELSDGCIGAFTVVNVNVGVFCMGLAMHAETIDEPWARTFTASFFGISGLAAWAMAAYAGGNRVLAKLETKQRERIAARQQG